MDDKKMLRIRLRARRQAHMAEEIESKSMQIGANVLSYLEGIQYNSVFCYVAHEGEVQTEALLKRLNQLGKAVYVPVVCGREMRLALWAPNMEGVIGSFGIWEPMVAEYYAGDVDIAIVPGLAFTGKGQRLGQGGGYYDRFFACSNAYKIGVCFGWQVLCDLPEETHDARMDIVMTESGIIYQE